MTNDQISTVHRLVCDAVDLARDRGDHHVLDRLQSATIHLWYALHASDDTAERLAAAEDQLAAARERADDEIAATLRRVLDQLRHETGGVA